MSNNHAKFSEQTWHANSTTTWRITFAVFTVLSIFAGLYSVLGNVPQWVKSEGEASSDPIRQSMAARTEPRPPESDHELPHEAKPGPKPSTSILNGVVAQENDDNKDKTKTPKSTDDQKPMTERERRLKSLEKSIEKEERPDRPSFKGLKAGKRKGGAVTFDDIKFDMAKGERFSRKLLTESINALVGERLRIKGYIRPSIRQKDLKKFIFVRDDKECCFGPGAAIFDCVLVTLADGETRDYTVRPITIEGDFYLKEFKGPDGRIWAVYRMKNSLVKN